MIHTTNFEINDFTESGKAKVLRMFQQGTKRDLSSRHTTMNWPSPVLIATGETDDIVVKIVYDKKNPRKKTVSIFGRNKTDVFGRET